MLSQKCGRLESSTADGGLFASPSPSNAAMAGPPRKMVLRVIRRVEPRPGAQGRRPGPQGRGPGPQGRSRASGAEVAQAGRSSGPRGQGHLVDMASQWHLGGEGQRPFRNDSCRAGWGRRHSSGSAPSPRHHGHRSQRPAEPDFVTMPSQGTSCTNCLMSRDVFPPQLGTSAHL